MEVEQVRTPLKVLSVPVSMLTGLLVLRHRARRRILKSAEERATPDGISSAEAVTLGGVEQWILIQGEDRDKPVLLVLHGGPGMPFPGVSYRTRSLLGQEDSELAKHFVVVYWDQRGSGKSNGPDVPKESITIDRLTSDAVELADLLGRRFGVEKVFLAGISWGTVLGLGAAAKAPEKFEAYVGMAQIANWAESDRLAYRWALERAEETDNQKAIEGLREIGAPPWGDFARWSTLRQWLMLLGGFYRSGGDPSAWRKRISEVVPFLAPGLPALLAPFFVSPDYGLSDLLRLFVGLKTSQEALLDDIADLDFFDSVPRVEVPVLFFHGAHDQAVQLLIARRYFEALEAPRGKRLDVLEESAHIFSPRDAARVEAALIERLPELARSGMVGAE